MLKCSLGLLGRIWIGRANIEAERTLRELFQESGWAMEVAWMTVMIVGEALWARALLGGRNGASSWGAGLGCAGRKRAKFKVSLDFWLKNLMCDQAAY